MGQKASKKIAEPATFTPCGQTFNYAEKRLYHHNSAIITQGGYSRYESIESMIETTIGGKRYIILQGNIFINQQFTIYLDERFNYVKERVVDLSSSLFTWYTGRIRKKMIVDENRLLIVMSDGIHFKQSDILQPLPPFGRVDYYRVLDDGSFQTLTNVKTIDKETEFDLIDYKRNNSFAGITAQAHTVPFKIEHVPENLFFVDQLDHHILAWFESTRLLVIYVKHDKENNIYHVIVQSTGDLLIVYKCYYTDRWNLEPQINVRAEEYYKLNIYFNEKSIKYQGNKMQFASLVPELYSVWRAEALKLLSGTDCLNKLASSLLRVIVDYVAS